MELTVPTILTYALGWFGFMGGIWALFDRAETVASSDTKRAVSRWLRNLDLTGSIANWPASFAAVFDTIFGKHYFSWRFFSRSCMASLGSVALLTIVVLALRIPWTDIFSDNSASPVFIRWPGRTLVAVIMGPVIMNLIPDYLSLIESRWIIRWMSRSNSRLQNIALILVDFLLTYVIFFLTGLLLSMFVLLFLHIFLPDYRNLWTAGEGGVLGLMLGTPIGRICLLSTFFTSAWVWVYALSGAAIRLLGHLGIVVGGLKKLLDIENKPIRSLGFVSMLLVTLVFIIVPFVR